MQWATLLIIVVHNPKQIEMHVSSLNIFEELRITDQKESLSASCFSRLRNLLSRTWSKWGAGNTVNNLL